MTIEEHPLTPFLPENGRMLFLGSFPPPKARWSMDWFYPNWINDFWRIQGLLHFGDKAYFEQKSGDGTSGKCFDKNRIVEFCAEQGMAFFDTARKVCRLKDNASDDFLDILEPTDVLALLAEMPRCGTIVTTGGKASEELCKYLENKGVKVAVPKVGESIRFSCVVNAEEGGVVRDITWWRMPNSSRAYPMRLEKKAEHYRKLF